MTDTVGQVVEIKMVSKLSMKTIGVNAKKVAALDGDNARLFLCNIFGMADGVKTVEDKNEGKIYHAMVGRFQANRPDGVVVRSGVLYLPSGIHDAYLTAIKGLPEGDTLNFAIGVWSVKSSNLAGYSYEAVNLLPPSAGDPLTQLAAQVETGATQAQLPAPSAQDAVPAQGKGNKAPAKRV
jgi:hypothetical protein